MGSERSGISSVSTTHWIGLSGRLLQGSMGRQCKDVKLLYDLWVGSESLRLKIMHTHSLFFRYIFARGTSWGALPFPGVYSE